MYDDQWEHRIKSGIKKGDKNAFGLLYKRFYDGLCRSAYRFTGKPEIAEEIVQDIFMKLWEGRKKTEIHGSMHTYLFSAVRNGSVNYLKRLILERKFNAKTARQFQNKVNYLQVSQDDGSSLLIAEELEKSLNEALGLLPPRCREIFLLNRKEGLKHHEIAEKLGISQNTVQRQVSIAIEKLSVRLLPHTNS
ncbi:MAG: RNA polymerase sigma-70 factor [Bacteroidales bacterium]